MERFETEEQQVEAIKRFWKEHGTAIIVGAALGLGGLWGWRYFSETQLASKEAASVAYQEAVESLAAEGGEAKVDAFIEANKDSGYASIASLLAAKQAVDSGDLDAAASHLNRVVTFAESEEMKAVASLRLSRVQIEMNQLDAALSTLGNVTNDAFSAEVSELKGDVYAKQSKFDDARLAYSSALEKNANNPLLQMKLDNLSVAAGQ
ncbi:MAG: tetratricopeptide repeat protein [Pseudomonadota bacterium]|jgi:predicted negative regulator of RcsB-dependent stress response|uniref:YfgM family protein n=1 Tax=Alteromonas sp. S167 TaxID=3117402 RepID=UPI002EC29232|nr:tetratricopeptide repeat protein [Pseudomonadota bacterium]MEC8375506.1 tetratricopeptide repeat protein [Pseudomonadota bacterium]MEC8418330.1 tetratricopeptide repeat protein [Pseudomonadota bacterium]